MGKLRDQCASRRFALRNHFEHTRQPFAIHIHQRLHKLLSRSACTRIRELSNLLDQRLNTRRALLALPHILLHGSSSFPRPAGISGWWQIGTSRIYRAARHNAAGEPRSRLPGGTTRARRFSLAASSLFSRRPGHLLALARARLMHRTGLYITCHYIYSSDGIGEGSIFPASSPV